MGTWWHGPPHSVGPKCGTGIAVFLFFSQVFLFTMLTLFDVLALCEDEERFQEWLRSYGVLRVKATKCVKCGSSMKDCVYRGKPHVVCSDQKCRAKVSDVVGGLLEGSKLSYKQSCGPQQMGLMERGVASRTGSVLRVVWILATFLVISKSSSGGGTLVQRTLS